MTNDRGGLYLVKRALKITRQTGRRMSGDELKCNHQKKCLKLSSYMCRHCGILRKLWFPGQSGRPLAPGQSSPFLFLLLLLFWRGNIDNPSWNSFEIQNITPHCKILFVLFVNYWLLLFSVDLFSVLQELRPVNRITWFLSPISAQKHRLSQKWVVYIYM